MHRKKGKKEKEIKKEVKNTGFYDCFLRKFSMNFENVY